MLVVDAAQGIEAQTLANVYLALEHDLAIVPGDQQDRPAQRRSPSVVAEEIERVIGLPLRRGDPRLGQRGHAACTEILEAIVKHDPAAQPATPTSPLRALIFD